MTRRTGRKPRPPLDKERLNELALFYVGRFATTRAKLAAYLGRKLRERGWNGPGEPDVDALVERFAEMGLIDDALYALSKSRSLSERGYGAGRVRLALRAAGIGEEDSAAAQDLAANEAVDAALRFAKRRRIGPFAASKPDRPAREKALAAMVRAGHGFEIARALIDCEPGEEPELDDFREKFR